MKTAIEFLIQELHDNGYFHNGVPENLVERAKQMEKFHIMEAYFNGCKTGEMFNNENRAFITDADGYYQETFKSE